FPARFPCFPFTAEGNDEPEPLLRASVRGVPRRAACFGREFGHGHGVVEDRLPARRNKVVLHQGFEVCAVYFRARPREEGFFPRDRFRLGERAPFRAAWGDRASFAIIDYEGDAGLSSPRIGDRVLVERFDHPVYIG